jgi:hypothetical protein
MIRLSFAFFSGFLLPGLILSACNSVPPGPEGNPGRYGAAGFPDALRFKQEYELLNGTRRTDGALLGPVEISPDNTFVYFSEEEALNFSRQGTGVIFLGAGWCRWCRSLAPEYIRMARGYSLYNTIYYVPVENDTGGGKGKAYRALAELAGNYMEKAGSSFANVSGNPAVVASYVKRNRDKGYGLFPAVTLFFNKGTLVGMHVGTVPGHNSDEPLDEDGIKALEEAFTKHFEVLGTNPCPAKC